LIGEPDEGDQKNALHELQPEKSCDPFSPIHVVEGFTEVPEMYIGKSEEGPISNTPW